MALWTGSLSLFIKEALTTSLDKVLSENFYKLYGSHPDKREQRSWANSLPALARALSDISNDEIGVALEYPLPCRARRTDVILFGRNSSGTPTGVIIELKQWERIYRKGTSANYKLNTKDTNHPCEQALSYSSLIKESQSFAQNPDFRLFACSYCHNATVRSDLCAIEFDDIMKNAPLFLKNEEPIMRDFLSSLISYGDGLSIMAEFLEGYYKPSSRLTDLIQKTLDGVKEWHLIDSQRVVYNDILDSILSDKTAEQKVFVVRGGPGTGKTIIGLYLLKQAIARKKNAVFCTTGKAFGTTFRARCDKSTDFFLEPWNVLRQKAGKFDLLLIDEAHRLHGNEKQSHREFLNTLFSRSNVTVLFLDERQAIRPNEAECVEQMIPLMKEKDMLFEEYNLNLQFRCNGSDSYLSWVESILGFSMSVSKIPLNYEFRLLDNPFEFDDLISRSTNRGETARIVAGYCWPWNDVGTNLPPEIQIGGWSRYWNPSTRGLVLEPCDDTAYWWANENRGQEYVGSVYLSQGFEFDSVGVIWGKDLVWRKDRWVAQPEESRDARVLRESSLVLTLLRNIYWVLLTRGIKRTHVLCLDEETKEYLGTKLKECFSAA